MAAIVMPPDVHYAGGHFSFKSLHWSRDAIEVPCDHPEPCGWVHRKADPSSVRLSAEMVPAPCTCEVA